ncbi:unnamed protein product [Durusdinium trenchii]|uniref:Uncharacterized protein n=2 Tax=Durusdinium trenchii TaxID=1381693 RepID=A0ABP0KKR3_9DINO
MTQLRRLEKVEEEIMKNKLTDRGDVLIAWSGVVFVAWHFMLETLSKTARADLCASCMNGGSTRAKKYSPLGRREGESDGDINILNIMEKKNIYFGHKFDECSNARMLVTELNVFDWWTWAMDAQDMEGKGGIEKAVNEMEKESVRLKPFENDKRTAEEELQQEGEPPYST